MTVKDFLSSITNISWENINLFVQNSEKTYLKLKVIEKEDLEEVYAKESFSKQEVVNIGFEYNEEEKKADIIVYTKKRQEVK